MPHYRKPGKAKSFYAAITFHGARNRHELLSRQPDESFSLAGIVQGSRHIPWLLIMRMTNNRSLMRNSHKHLGVGYNPGDRCASLSVRMFSSFEN
jgi:hypothetical protein